MQSSYLDPALGYRNSGLRDELSGDDDNDDDDGYGRQGVLVDVVPDTDSGYNLQVVKPGTSGSGIGAATSSGGGGSGNGERRRRRERR